jgi:transposase
MAEPKRRSKTKKRAIRAMPVIQPDAAGIDIGSRTHWVAVPEDRDDEPVREFGTFTQDLHELADWLKACGVKTVAMESTGVYWIPVFELLEAEGFEVMLVNAAQVRNVPGRKSDVIDCRWIQCLHSLGLLRASFRPSAQFVELRTYMRQRERLVQDAARNVQHMQKALMEMNVQVHHVLSDITGTTGMKIIKAIVAGEHDGDKLAQLRDPRCRASKMRIAAALQGNFKREHLFVLQQALTAYETNQRLLEECDDQADHLLQQLVACSDPPDEPCPPPRFGRPHNKQPTFPIQSPLHCICDEVDITQIPGIAPATALNLIAEIGTDMSRWPTVKHFTSWLNLAPGTKITGGKSLSSRRGPAKNRAGLVLRQAAVSVGRTSTALGAFYRRISLRKSSGNAVVATARKLAILVYNALKHGQAYVEQGLEAYDAQQQVRTLKSLERRANAMGYKLAPAMTTEGVT